MVSTCGEAIGSFHTTGLARTSTRQAPAPAGGSAVADRPGRRRSHRRMLPAHATFPGQNGRIAFRASSTRNAPGERSSASGPTARANARSPTHRRALWTAIPTSLPTGGGSRSNARASTVDPTAATTRCVRRQRRQNPPHPAHPQPPWPSLWQRRFLQWLTGLVARRPEDPVPRQSGRPRGDLRQPVHHPPRPTS